MSTETWELPTSSAAIFPKVESDRLENEENYYVWSVRMRNAFESCEMMGVVDGSETCPPDDTTQGHDHAVREGRPRHQGRPRQTRKRILGHVCVRVQPNRLRIDYAMVQATDQATLLRWRHLRTCYRLPGSYPLPCKCRI